MYLDEQELQKSRKHSILIGTMNTELQWRGRVELVLLGYDQHLRDP